MLSVNLLLKADTKKSVVCDAGVEHIALAYARAYACRSREQKLHEKGTWASQLSFNFSYVLVSHRCRQRRLRRDHKKWGRRSVNRTRRNLIKVKTLSFFFAAAAMLFAVSAGVGQTLTGDQLRADATSVKVFQGAGPNPASIRAVDQFRAALGGINNANAPGPLGGGRREINWDGGGSTATSPGATPFDVFLNNRGNRSTTPGTGFVRAPPSVGRLFCEPELRGHLSGVEPGQVILAGGQQHHRHELFIPGTPAPRRQRHADLASCLPMWTSRTAAAPATNAATEKRRLWLNILRRTDRSECLAVLRPHHPATADFRSSA